MTNDRESVCAIYQRAKYDLKMDFITWLLFSALFSCAVALLIVIIGPVDFWVLCFFSIYVGVLLASVPIGFKVVFSFALRVLQAFEFIGIGILVIAFVALFAASLLYGPLIVIIKFIIGMVDTRKIKELLN